jgi:hypothetical protein
VIAAAAVAAGTVAAVARVHPQVRMTGEQGNASTRRRVAAAASEVKALAASEVKALFVTSLKSTSRASTTSLRLKSTARSTRRKRRSPR